MVLVEELERPAVRTFVVRVLEVDLCLAEGVVVATVAAGGFTGAGTKGLVIIDATIFSRPGGVLTDATPDGGVAKDASVCGSPFEWRCIASSSSTLSSAFRNFSSRSFIL